jgi:integrase
MAIRHWLDTCAQMGEIRELPEIKWSVPGKTKSKRFKAYPRELVEQWIIALRKHRPRAAAVAEWVAATGWRIGDALDLRVGEMDLKRNTIDRDQIKTAEALPYPLTPALRAMALDALQGRDKPDPDEHVFLDHRGRPWDYQQLVKLIDYFHKSKRWDGPAINFRDLRKSFGSSLAMDCCPPNVLKELMGHSSIEMTLSYYVAVDLPKMAEWSNRHAPLKAQPKAPPAVSPEQDSQ